MKELLDQVVALDEDRQLGNPEDRRNTAARLDLIRSWKYARAKATEVKT